MELCEIKITCEFSVFGIQSATLQFYLELILYNAICTRDVS